MVRANDAAAECQPGPRVAASSFDWGGGDFGSGGVLGGGGGGAPWAPGFRTIPERKTSTRIAISKTARATNSHTEPICERKSKLISGSPRDKRNSRYLHGKSGRKLAR